MSRVVSWTCYFRSFRDVLFSFSQSRQRRAHNAANPWRARQDKVAVREDLPSLLISPAAHGAGQYYRFCGRIKTPFFPFLDVGFDVVSGFSVSDWEIAIAIAVRKCWLYT
jgi:hypothetical protein